MDFFAYLRAIRRSWLIIVVLVLVGASGFLVMSKRSAPVYQGQVGFYVSSPNLSVDTALSTDQFAQDRAISYAALLSSDRLAGLILRAHPNLDLSEKQLASKITGAAALNTIIVTATVLDTSTARLETIVDAVGAQFPEMIGQLDPTRSGPAAVSLRVVTGPSVSQGPVAPRTKLNVLVGAALGLLVGLVLAVLRDLLDLSLTDGGELAELTGAPVLASIGVDPQARRDPLIVGERSHGLRAEQFRQLRTSLQFIDVARSARTIVVTSSVEGEGKSTTATNLALVFAETGAQVLLIEADLRRPKIADYLGIERAAGLTTVLTRRLALSDAVQPWGTHGVSVLASGPLPPNPSELLGSDAMRSLIAQARSRYDVVIIDTPPVLPVTDATVLGGIVDGVVVVFRASSTRRAQVRTAVEALRTVDARVVGSVLNMRPTSGVDAADYREYYSTRHEPAGRWTRLRSRLTRRWSQDAVLGSEPLLEQNAMGPQLSVLPDSFESSLQAPQRFTLPDDEGDRLRPTTTPGARSR